MCIGAELVSVSQRKTVIWEGDMVERLREVEGSWDQNTNTDIDRFRDINTMKK